LAWVASATPASAQTITPTLSSAILGGGSTTTTSGSSGGGTYGGALGGSFGGSLGGNANLGGTTGGTQGGGNNSTTNATVPTKINSFTPYMGSPYAAAMGQNNTLTPSNSLSSSSSGTSGISNFQLLEALSATQGTIAFGNPLYPQTKGTNTGTTMGGGLGGGGTGTTIGGRFPGVSTVGMRRAPTFVTALAEDLKPSGYSSIVPPPNQMVMELRGALDRSTSLREPSNIRLYMEDSTVVLQGVVASDKERRLAEGLVRVTPGVRDVRNELVVNRPTGP
jgi:hypothetical protein